jgi:transcriptional regulator with XRE-family HTH domain
MNIGGTLAAYARKREVPKRRLVKKLGITREGLRLILNGSRIPRVTTLEKMIHVLGIPQTAAVELREAAANMRVARMGFVKEKAIDDMWEEIHGRLSPAFSDVIMAAFEEVFREAVERHLKG